MKRCRPRARGFSLIELLISLVVLSIGLLGMAGLNMVSLRNNTGSYLRSQARVFAEDLVDRIYANRNAVSTAYLLDPAIPPANPNLDCRSNSCTAAQMAQYDLYQWYVQAQQALPAFKARVTCNPASCATPAIQTVIVMWDEPDGRDGAGTDCSKDYDVDLYCYALNVASQNTITVVP